MSANISKALGKIIHTESISNPSSSAFIEELCLNNERRIRNVPKIKNAIMLSLIFPTKAPNTSTQTHFARIDTVMQRNMNIFSTNLKESLVMIRLIFMEVTALGRKEIGAQKFEARKYIET